MTQTLDDKVATLVKKTENDMNDLCKDLGEQRISTKANWPLPTIYQPPPTSAPTLVWLNRGVICHSVSGTAKISLQ